MDKASKILIAGHTGLLGSALRRVLHAAGFDQLVCASSAEVDFRRQRETEDFISQCSPDYMLIAAGRVGGIRENREHPAELIYDNLMIQSNLMQAARVSEVSKLLFVGSTCMYPRACEQPMREDMLGAGRIEPTSAAYATAKMAGVFMAAAYQEQYMQPAVVMIPCSLYGPHDEFNPDKGHLLSALITRFHIAVRDQVERVTLWGSGKPVREFLYVDDAAEAALQLMQTCDDVAPINVGCGQGHSVRELAEIVAHTVGFEGQIDFDNTHPDGAPCKVLDTGRIEAIEWHPKVTLEDGIARTYKWFLDNVDYA